MTNLLLASQCPTPQLRSTFLSLSAASVLANAPVSSRYVSGDSTALLGKLNANATRQDLVASFGGGAYFVAQGLLITAGIGLTISVAPGTAVIDGPVNLEAATVLAVPASASPVFVWLEQSGSLTYTVNLTPPAAASCLLGNVTTSATAVTAVDTSGVLYGSGILQRTTADTGMPTDTPPAGLHFVTVTQGGTFYWNGSAYINVQAPANPSIVSLAASTQTFSAAGKNYLVTATFSAAGSFGDAFYESSLIPSNSNFTVSPNEAGRTTGAMSWIVYAPSDQGSNLANIGLTASLRGRGWSGITTSGVAATWTVTQIA